MRAVKETISALWKPLDLQKPFAIVAKNIVLKSATMKYFLPFSLALVFFQVIEGNTMSSPSSPHVFLETNNVEDEYGTSAISSGDDGGIKINWKWEPWGNQKNKIKFGPVLPFFSMSDDESGFDSSETGTENDDDMFEDIHPPIPHSDWSFIEVKNVKKEKSKPKTESIVGRRYLAHEKHLKKSNWCFKENKDSHHHKFKKTDVCCRKRRECRRTKLAVKRGIYQCSCDLDFYICLAKSGTAMSKSIGRLYFDNQNVVCYRKLSTKHCTKLPCNVQYKRKIINHFPQ